MTVQLVLAKMVPQHTEVITVIGLRYKAQNTKADRVKMLAILNDHLTHTNQLRVISVGLQGQKLTSRWAAQ